MQFWNNIAQLINKDQKVLLLCVFENKGSSPGKQGFKMAITDDGGMFGSIGGGIMEQKLVELSKNLLKASNPFQPFIKKQIHNKEVEENQSGMICSGEQTIGFYKLTQKDVNTVIAINNTNQKTIILSEKGLTISADLQHGDPTFEHLSTANWIYKECVSNKHTIHIIGAGHVGLALSQTVNSLGFYVKIYDDRNNLNTLNQNNYAHEKQIVDFSELGKIIPSSEHDYVVLASFGYRTDKIALKQLIHHNFKYIGMMGSEAKVKQLYAELENEGIKKSALEKVYAPIGITKHNKTPAEIAISIAAQMIQIKNS